VPMEYFPKELASLGCSLVGYGLGELQARLKARNEVNEQFLVLK
jgi:hypothetical protein